MVGPFSRLLSLVADDRPSRNATVHFHTATDASGRTGRCRAATTCRRIQNEGPRPCKKVKHVCRVGELQGYLFLPLRDRSVSTGLFAGVPCFMFH